MKLMPSDAVKRDDTKGEHSYVDGMWKFYIHRAEPEQDGEWVTIAAFCATIAEVLVLQNLFKFLQASVSYRDWQPRLS